MGQEADMNYIKVARLDRMKKTAKHSVSMPSLVSNLTYMK